MQQSNPTKRSWLWFVVAPSVALYLAVYGTYVWLMHGTPHGSYVPFVIGNLGVFAMMAYRVHRQAAFKSAWLRFTLTAGAGLLASLAFTFLFLALVLNTLGS